MGKQRTSLQPPVRALLTALIALAALSAACSSALFGQTAILEPESSEPAPTEHAPVTPAFLPTPLSDDLLAEASAEELALINIYQRVNPAVVYIDISVNDSEGALQDLASGSGFVIDPEGYIVTNRHVIVDAEEVRVTFSDGVVLLAEVLGSDPYADLAVLKVEPPPEYQLVAVELADSDELLVGQRVIAIGNPFGLSGTMTVGIISAVGRTLPSSVLSVTGSFSNPLIIQTDAAINPGNSGGPLLDSRGRVIGVNTAIRSETGVNSGIGFAVPVNTVRRIVPQIIENGEVEYPYLGISAQTIYTLADLATEFDLPVTEGVMIDQITSGSGAARAGLRGGDDTVDFHGTQIALGGDIITAIDDFPIRNFDELLGYLVANTSVGQEVIVTIYRDGERMDVPVELSARPAE
jgi:S1-C subfamily serine protease